MDIRGIDVSHWQGTIDWKKVKASGIEFAMIKAGGSDGKTTKYYTDECFKTNYTKAKAAGLHVGAYYFVGSDFVTIKNGIDEANRFIEMLKGLYCDMPVALDIETTPKSQKEGATRATIAFCDTMELAGYYPIIYASDLSGFKERLELSRLKRFDKWVAKYSTSNPKHVTDWKIWQYSSNGVVDGIKGRVDLNKATFNYPPLIKSCGVNGYKSNGQNEIYPSILEAAEGVKNGIYGEGAARTRALIASGFNPSEVMKLVNSI